MRARATALTPQDLAVGCCDSHRLYLAAPALGERLEAWGMHALNLRTHTPPLARFVTELSHALCAQVTAFDWDAAARLPFLPRMRYGRTVLPPPGGGWTPPSCPPGRPAGRGGTLPRPGGAPAAAYRAWCTWPRMTGCSP
jgi:hypothetical protein